MERHRKLIKDICPKCGQEKNRRKNRVGAMCRKCLRSVKNSKLIGDLNPKWKGGMAKHSKGYVRVSSHGHPRQGKNGYVFEHILVMEKVIGRFLKPGENVHHKNGIKNDNRPGNLELWTTGHPSGARVEDLVEWVTREYPEQVKRFFGL